ncbi:MAG: hypothetical protein MUF21_05015 [Gemmatimonadaceae bacterium]|nr:hypothetical protein [Gemmatimonadaceae bacterium]
MSVGLLDFFVLEASDYVDRLQRLVSTTEPHGPDSALLLKLAGGLRGSAAMARLGSFAEATEGVEQGARLLREGRIAWTPALREAMMGAVADLRALVPMARMWGDGHDERARSAARALARTIETIDRASQQMTGGTPARPMPAVRRGTPSDAAVHAFQDALTAGRPSSPTPAAHFPGARDAALPIVPILALAFDDAVDAIVVRAPMPPITAAERFAREIEPLVASLRARLAPFRAGALHEAPADLLSAFKPVLASIRELAAGYGFDDVRDFCDAMQGAPVPLPASAAGALDGALALLAEGEAHGTHRAQKLAELRRVILAATPLAMPTAQSISRPRLTPLGGAAVRRGTPAVNRAVSRPTPTVRTPTPAVRLPTPHGRELSQLLSSQLEVMRELQATPLDLSAIPDVPAAPPTIGIAPDGEPDIVPIDMLLYRGVRALGRARHLVTQLRATEAPADPVVLAELFDLVELATTAH